MNYIHPVPVQCAKTGKMLGFAEGNLRAALALQATEDARRKMILRIEASESDSPTLAIGRNRTMRDSRYYEWDDDSRKGEDRSWKYNRFQPRPRTLCKRARRKAQYN